MWALPPDLARLKVALPEGLLLLPHHYATADRERLLTLLRALMPECGQTLIEARSLPALTERRLTLPDGIVLLHGFPEGEEVEGLRARVAPLGARHLLVQMPRPQLTGTGWMEPTLKVPLLRAIEGAWRNPQHPLHVVGIHHLAVREAAKCTDDVVEFLTIVEEAVEHRLRNVAAGVAAEDWGRSLDHALASRLLARMAGPLPSAAVSLARGETPSEDGEVEALAARGLVVETSSGPRATPLLHALARPRTATRAVLNIRGEDDVGRESARELFHMAREVVPLEAHFAAWDPAWLRETGLDRALDTYRFSPKDPHRWLLDRPKDEVISAAVLWLQNEASSSGDSDRDSRFALATYFRSLITRGHDHHAELFDAVDDVRGAELARPLREKLPVMAALVVALRLFIERSTAQDHEHVTTLLRTIEKAGSGLSRGAQHAHWALSKVAGVPTARSGPIYYSSVLQLIAVAHRADPPERFVRYMGFIARGLPAGGWFALWVDEPQYVARLAATRSNRRGTLTLDDLHRDLVMGVAALAEGDLDAALSHGRDVLDLAGAHELPVLRAFARELMASVNELRGEYDEAAQLLLRARSRYVALADSDRIAGVERRLTRMGIDFEPSPTPA